MCSKWQWRYACSLLWAPLCKPTDAGVTSLIPDTQDGLNPITMCAFVNRDGSCGGQDIGDILLHEMSHSWARTDDNGYGMANIQRIDADSSLNNADSYPRFAKAVHLRCSVQAMLAPGTGGTPVLDPRPGSSKPKPDPELGPSNPGPSPFDQFGTPKLTPGPAPSNPEPRPLDQSGNPELIPGPVPADEFGNPKLIPGPVPADEFGIPKLIPGPVPADEFGIPKLSPEFGPSNPEVVPVDEPGNPKPGPEFSSSEPVLVPLDESSNLIISSL